LKRALSDPFSFKNINVYYDGKLLPESSFGQRCTAAVVLLLLLGNHPIVIDEPEGHLDSLLIANYLVELIKRAKEHRQIIFATHNANLVVNGDADLVYHLEMTDQKRSTLTPVVLEDPEQRHRIVSLEGGHDAFRKRENKYRKRKFA
jgi:ABC-type lipoprotein export system ATPase subunit